VAPPEGKYQVPAVVGAISVLNQLSTTGESGATLSELVESTGLSKSTMHNLLSTLDSHGFVRRDANTRQYRLGPALIPLGTEATRQVKLVRSTLDQVAPLAARHGLSFAVAVSVVPSPYSAGPFSRMPCTPIAAPSPASVSAKARPSPRPAPVTRATRPWSGLSVIFRVLPDGWTISAAVADRRQRISTEHGSTSNLHNDSH